MPADRLHQTAYDTKPHQFQQPHGSKQFRRTYRALSRRRRRYVFV